MEYHKQLAEIIEDQLSLASIHYLRAHYQEAIDIYKGILSDNRYGIFFYTLSFREILYISFVFANLF